MTQQTRQTALMEANDRLFEPKNDIILQKCACVLVPFIMIFGIYIILNGHLSPGGGFLRRRGTGIGSDPLFKCLRLREDGTLLHRESVPQNYTLRADILLRGEKLFFLYRREPFRERNPSWNSRGHLKQRADSASQHLRGSWLWRCTMYAFYTLFRKGGM